MRDLFIKYFGRILAILGCTTLVTACYGVPYAHYHVSGHIVDSETDQPIKDIKVRAVPSYEGTDEYPFDMSTTTDSLGYFELYGAGDIEPPVYIIECNDVDGELNGSYEPVIEEIPYEESYDIVIRMTPEHKKHRSCLTK